MPSHMSERSEKTSLSQRPKPWPQDLVKNQIKGVCLDIDDTLSTQGKLTSEAYESLWSLKKAGFAVVPITGRPAGWCDHFARFWPVDAVVGENGAFTFFMSQGVRRRINTPAGATEETLKQKLNELSLKIKNQFYDVRWASDQAYREFDLAIDVCEDVAPWPMDQVNALLDLCKSEGAHAKLSSIHVNTWFGEYDKKKGFQYWLAQGAPGLTGPVPALDEWIYIGDSPNDEPMFSHFKYSVGVANLHQYLGRLQYFPTWITSQESGKGFSEMAQQLIESRKSE